MPSLAKHLLLALAAFCLTVAPAPAAEPAPAIDWQPWSDTLFDQAKKEHKFVFLDLGAGWCHWCHVMDEITYQDPDVIKLLRAKYIAVRVDQDSRPDLSNRYEDYGWPATIVFNSDGAEIVKRQGYIPPKPMASLLQAIIDDPTPGPSVRPESALVPAAGVTLKEERRTELKDLLIEAYDPKQRGWGESHKFIDWDIVEYALRQPDGAAAPWSTMARD